MKSKITLQFIAQILFVVALMFFSPCNALGQSTTYKVATSKLNVRAAPNTNSKIVGSLQGGTSVKVNSISKGWATISYQGQTCYVSAQHLTMADTKYNSSKQSASSVTRSSQTSSDNDKALWNFMLGGMPHMFVGENCFDFFAQLGGDIPITLGGRPYLLETGLRYLNKRSVVTPTNDNGNYFDGNASLVEIPVRLGYDRPLGRDFSIRLSGGPYFSYMFNDAGGIQVGVEPSVALKYKQVSVGFTISVPLYKGYKNESSNVVMLTLGVRFGGKVWKSIGTGALVVGAAAAAAIGSEIENSVKNNANNDIGNGARTIDAGDGNGGVRNCKICHGSGRCSHCAGRGNCTKCAGRGVMKGRSSGTFINCPRCNGSGSCNFCKGGGQCHVCHGKGTRSN